MSSSPSSTDESFIMIEMAKEQHQSTVLHDDWSFRQADEQEWLSVRSVPTNVHLDLLDHKKIEDPFLDFNELKCQWVAEKTWIYRRTLSAKKSDNVRHVLALDGLDTFAKVSINGDVVLTSDNMWHMHRVDVTQYLYGEQDATLEIEFEPALLKAREIKDKHPEHTWVGFNGDMARLAVRKAQYHWGWDWGPVLMPCGPWREVRLESYVAKIEELSLDYEVKSDSSVEGTVVARLDGDGDRVDFEVSFNSEVVHKMSASVNKGAAQAQFRLSHANLWYPHGYGKPSMYHVTAKLVTREDVPLHTTSIQTGFRKCELVQQPDAIGKSFYFRINDIDIFCGGSDWIPTDSFTPRSTTETYRSWLQSMVDGHQVMIRNWGGGNWEHDDFYDIADELGILVWQDFMFGCGNYPCFPDLLKSIEREGVTQTRRLRHHPSMTIYAGNNEDYQVQESAGLTYRYEDKDPESWLKTDFPARYLYEKLLPEIVAKHSPHIPYHPGSPWGDGKISSDPTVGDMHQWNVWHGTQEKYQIFDTLGGRFNSEFGMEAFPHLETIQSFVSDSKQLFPQSHVIDFHNKADGHERRLATYLVENFRVNSYDLAQYIYLTQMGQAEALMFGYRGWRKQWGQARHCGGALVWQLNDCWPTISWAIVDYYERKKPAWYALKRVLAPIAVAVKRDHHDWSVVHAKPAAQLKWECWVVSSLLKDVKATVEVRFISIASGKDIKHAVQKEVDVVANGTTTVVSGVLDNTSEEPHVLAARILVDGKVVARDSDWPQPFKYLDLSDRQVEVTRSKPGRLNIKVGKPVKGLVFEERTGVKLSDSALDLMPGDEQEIDADGLDEGAKDLRYTYLGAA